MRTRKNLHSGNGFTNKKMNESVYLERRTVMNHIYTAKNLLKANGIELPRIDIRIVDADRSKVSSLGRARLGDNIVWIPSDVLTRYPKHLYQIVLHELLHAVWSIGHDKRSKLMHPNLQMGLKTEEAEQIFLRYAKKYA